MADIIRPEDLEEKVETSSTEEETTDPLKEELERVQRSKYTEKEKAEHAFKNTAKRLKELGADPSEVLGLKNDPEDEEDKPLTVGMWKKMQQEQAQKTALQLAEEIPSETERELIKYHLSNSIRSTGNPSEDLDLARAIVNSKKNAQILEEVTRKATPKTYIPNGGASKETEVEPELTKDEMQFTKAPFNMSKAEILKSRQ